MSYWTYVGQGADGKAAGAADFLLFPLCVNLVVCFSLCMYDGEKKVLVCGLMPRARSMAVLGRYPLLLIRDPTPCVQLPKQLSAA